MTRPAHQPAAPRHAPAGQPGAAVHELVSRRRTRAATKDFHQDATDATISLLAGVDMRGLHRCVHVQVRGQAGRALLLLEPASG
jgi:hypothetical protein